MAHHHKIKTTYQINNINHLQKTRLHKTKVLAAQ